MTKLILNLALIISGILILPVNALEPTETELRQEIDVAERNISCTSKYLAELMNKRETCNALAQRKEIDAEILGVRSDLMVEREILADLLAELNRITEASLPLSTPGPLHNSQPITPIAYSKANSPIILGKFTVVSVGLAYTNRLQEQLPKDYQKGQIHPKFTDPAYVALKLREANQNNLHPVEFTSPLNNLCQLCPAKPSQ